jgi:hypothetical protein
MDVRELDMSSGEWLILARNNYLLEDVEEFCRQQGYVYQSRSWNPQLSDEIYAIRLWEHLRKGHSIPATEAKTVYRYISAGVGIKGGSKNLSSLKLDGVVNLGDLKESHGLLVDSIWHHSLDRISGENKLYYVSVLRRGENLTKTPRIKISTIHGAKGGESDNVVLLTDMSYRTWTESHKRPNDEDRVFYVGVTRSKSALRIIEPRGERAYQI